MNFKDKRPFLIGRLRIEIREKRELKGDALGAVGSRLDPHGVLFLGETSMVGGNGMP